MQIFPLQAQTRDAKDDQNPSDTFRAQKTLFQNLAKKSPSSSLSGYYIVEDETQTTMMQGLANQNQKQKIFITNKEERLRR